MARTPKITVMQGKPGTTCLGTTLLNPGERDMVVSANKGTPIYTPIYYNPHYGDHEKVPVISGNPHFTPILENQVEKWKLKWKLGAYRGITTHTSIYIKKSMLLALSPSLLCYPEGPAT